VKADEEHLGGRLPAPLEKPSSDGKQSSNPSRYYKRRRLGPLLTSAAASGVVYGAAHAFIGGTGAVGGAALLHMVSLYEEMFTRRRPAPDQVPLLLATGRNEADVSVFTRRLFRVAQSRYGDASRPTRIRSGYLTHSGIFVALDRFRIALLPQLEDADYLPRGEREAAVEAAVAAIRAESGEPNASLGALLSRHISAARPFATYLRNYAAEHLADRDRRFLSVTLGIPLPTVIAYHQDALRLISAIGGSLSLTEIEELKEQFADALTQDLREVRESLAARLLIAHTTGVGGMYDEDEDGPKRKTATRLGFAHAAQDEVLAEKHHYANALAARYAAAGLLVLITAAAVGIDEVKVDERVPLHPKIVHRLFELPREVFPGSKQMMNPESKAAKLAGRSIPARQYVGIHSPARIPLLSPPRSADLTFPRISELQPRLAIRSGENGIFSIANAEALYRTMRVASASELGTLLATVGLFGDDPHLPWFPDNICYYRESDNSRQVFDFLRLPPLLECQIGGLEPMALQNLGSSKHQGELHYLALLILFYRLRTLDLDAIDPYVDAAHFDPNRFFIDNSRPLTFEDVDAWELGPTARALTTLAAAQTWDDLLSLKPAPSRLGLFPQRDRALRTLFDRILAAVWTISSLGTPIVFEEGGVAVVSTGYFMAPLDIVLDSSADMYEYLRQQHEKVKRTTAFTEFVNFQLCDRGFIDLRPHAIVSAARTPEDDLPNRLGVAIDGEGMRRLLAAIKPYSYFSTCGLLAVLFRLRALYQLLREAILELGTYPDFRWQMPRDERGHIVVLPGACEAFRMVSEGLEKSTGLEHLDGVWGYGRAGDLERRKEILGTDESFMAGAAKTPTASAPGRRGRS